MKRGHFPSERHLLHRVIGLAQGQLANVSGIRDEHSRLGGSVGHELCASHLSSHRARLSQGPICHPASHGSAWEQSG